MKKKSNRKNSKRILRKGTRISKRNSRKYTIRNSRKYLKKNSRKYRKKNKRTYRKKKSLKKNKKIGGAADAAADAAAADAAAADAAKCQVCKLPCTIVPPDDHLIDISPTDCKITEDDYKDDIKKKNIRDLLLLNEWYPEPQVDAFLEKKMSGEYNLENMKEVNIASFSNYYRKSIYKLIEIIDSILDDKADVVISGGDGLNNNLDQKDRLVSPDIDVKVKLKGVSVDMSDDEKLDLYKECVTLVEQIVDEIVQALNYLEGGTMLNPVEIRNLFYPETERTYGKYKFNICEPNPYFLNKLDHSFDNSALNCKYGLPWSRRTTEMEAGGQEPPYTLNNVKLIGIDLRFKNCPYFVSLAGVLDIVIAVPGHIGHNYMEVRNENEEKGYYMKTIEHLNIFCINLEYYIYECFQMIKYGLRTKNKKMITDLKRYKKLVDIGKCDKDADIIILIEDIINKVKIDKQWTDVEIQEARTIITQLQPRSQSIEGGAGCLEISEYDPIDPCSCHEYIENNNIYAEVYGFEEEKFYDNYLSYKETVSPLSNPYDCTEMKGGNQRRKYKQKGGFISDIGSGLEVNTPSIGKILQRLNICDALDASDGNIIIDIPDIDDYNINLKPHNKLRHSTPDEIHKDYMEDIMISKRINYEELQGGKDKGTGNQGDWLSRPPYECYGKMDVTNHTIVGFEGNQFNTSAILLEPFSAIIAGDIFRHITNKLNVETIIKLAQFRSFNENFTSESAKISAKISAQYILSSIIPGLNIDKILIQKISLNTKVCPNESVNNWKLQQTEFSLSKEITDWRLQINVSNMVPDCTPFKYLAQSINLFYNKIQEIADLQ